MRDIFLNRILILLLLVVSGNYGVSAQTGMQDSITFKGIILNIDGKPVSGASVELIGSEAEPVITDSTGEFSLKKTAEPGWISIKSLDHQNKNFLVEADTMKVVYISPSDILTGEQVINTGIFDQESNKVISSVQQLSLEKDKYIKPTVTLGDYLDGKVPGLLSIKNSAMPGSGSYLMMRGPRSINTNNQPLYIVDGIPLELSGTIISRIEGNDHNPLSTINPLDISEITILKDAGAAAIYGINASNGVILINTLNPSATQTTIDFMIRGGFSVRPKEIPQLNNVQFKSLSNEILASSNLFEEEYEELYPGLYLEPGDLGYAPYQHNTNWQDEIFTTGASSEANLIVKGGDEISRYGLSVGYLNKSGVIKNSDFTRYNIRFSSFLQVYSWLEMSVNASLNNSNASLMPSALSQEASPVLTSLFKAPILSPFNYDDNGNQLRSIADVKEFEISNPRAAVNRTISENTNNRFMSTINLKADISSFLQWKSMLGINLYSLKEQIFRPHIGMADYFDGLAYSFSEENTNQLSSIYTNHSMSFNQQFNQIHQLNASIGFRIHTNDFEQDWGRAKNLPDNDEFSELQSGDNSLRELGGYTETWNRFASYAGLNYVLMDRYILSGNLSFDFTSRNGKDSKQLINIGNMPFGSFYSIAAGWRLSEESILKDNSWLENLLIRASYGVTGNDDIGNFNSVDYYMQVRYRETSGLIPGTIPNTGLKHEDSKQLDLGLDISLLADRYSIKLDYFQNLTSDLFFFEPQEAYIGYQNRPVNGGEILNQGIEMGLFSRIIHSKDLSWDINLNLTFLKNEVRNTKDSYVFNFPGGQYITENGEQVNSFYGYKFLGVFSTSEEATEANLINDRGRMYGAGDSKFKDISGPEGNPDGVINGYDKIVLGSPVPDLFGTFYNRIRYKKLTIELLIDVVSGREVFNYVRYQNEKMTDLQNQSIAVLNRWQKDGDQTEMPRALWRDPIGNTDFSSRWVEDGSFLRLRDLTVSYKFSEQIYVFRDAEIFISARNLFTLSPYLGYDPEFSHSYRPMDQGIDYGLMPQTPEFMAGIKVGL